MPPPPKIDDPGPNNDHGKAEKLAHGKRPHDQPELGVQVPEALQSRTAPTHTRSINSQERAHGKGRLAKPPEHCKQKYSFKKGFIKLRPGWRNRCCGSRGKYIPQGTFVIRPYNSPLMKFQSVQKYIPGGSPGIVNPQDSRCSGGISCRKKFPI